PVEVVGRISGQVRQHAEQHVGQRRQVPHVDLAKDLEVLVGALVHAGEVHALHFGVAHGPPRSRFSGTNLLAMRVAPCGSRMTVLRVHGASKGASTTEPPSSAALAAVASASSVPNVTLQWAGTPA